MHPYLKIYIYFFSCYYKINICFIVRYFFFLISELHKPRGGKIDRIVLGLFDSLARGSQGDDDVGSERAPRLLIRNFPRCRPVWRCVAIIIPSSRRKPVV